MRRLLLVNALIFAVLAAAVTLVYYGSTAVPSRDKELELMQALAEEKVLNIESVINANDTRLLNAVTIDELDKIDEHVQQTRASVVTVFLLDDQLKLVLDSSRTVGAIDPKEAAATRDWYIANVLPRAGLARLPLNTRGHTYGRNGDKPFLLTYMKKRSPAGSGAEDRTYYVVLEDDITQYVMRLFPQFFAEQSRRLYQVVDERGTFRAGNLGTELFSVEPGRLAVAYPFKDTLDKWQLRITERDASVQQELDRKRVTTLLLIGGSTVIIVAGLAFLALAIRRERRASELKSDFISNVSHELKTPLSIISLFGEMLANNRTKSPEQATEYAEIIWRESVRLGRLIDNVLDFAKIERGTVYEFADADVAEVVERAIDLAQRRVATAEMTLTADIEPDLPLVQLDANAFTLAVLNLIDNAIKYAVEGKKIEVSLKRRDDRLVLAVRDYGPGIDPEEHERIFERFYRAKAMRLKPIRGSGIGLALVQHIARAHGGDVTVKSTPGQGSTFELWLPVVV